MRKNISHTHTRSAINAIAPRPLVCSTKRRRRQQGVGHGIHSALSAAGCNAGCTGRQPKTRGTQGFGIGEKAILLPRLKLTGVGTSRGSTESPLSRSKKCEPLRKERVPFAAETPASCLLTIHTSMAASARCSAKRATHSLDGTRIRQTRFSGSSDTWNSIRGNRTR